MERQIYLTNTLVIITADHGAYVPITDDENSNINLEVNGELQTFVRNVGNLTPKPLEPLKSKDIDCLLHPV